MKKIGILGGTFDPIHNQHIKIAKTAYHKLKLDEVWILPTNKNPLKNNVSASTKQRITMIKLTIENFPWLKLNQYELQTKNKVNYTIDTIKHLKTTYPNTNFFFIIGSDNLYTLNKWKEINELTNLIQIIVVNRPHYRKSIKLMKKYHCQNLIVQPSSDISSSKIRSGEIINLLNSKVIDYINENLIYVHERLKFYLNNECYQHCINVGQTAKELAKKHHVNTNKALIAGTFHDIAKQWSKEKLTNYLNKYYPEGLKAPFNLYHAYVGALYLKHHWKFQNQDITTAIFKHTSGALEMSKLDLVVFLADKISYERNYPQVKEIRKLANENLTLAFSKYLELLKSHLIEKKIKLNHDFHLIYQKWHQK
ncbi:MAG: nicotinate-nucleotide adenylyltransferase [Spiroplasma sp.]